jgi:hypothetical protein
MQTVTVAGDQAPAAAFTLVVADLKQCALDLEEVLNMGPVMAHLGDNRNLHDLLAVLKLMTKPQSVNFPASAELTQ